MKSYSYTINYDRQLDIWNWYHACNSEGYGVNWGSRVDSEAASNLQALSYDDAVKYMESYLDRLFTKEADMINYGRTFIKNRFENDFQNACIKLEEITGRGLYRNDFTVHLTTFPRAPYIYDSGEFWLPFQWTNPIANFMHETLHFQTICYWRKNPNSLVAKLNENDFNNLKEALTVVLDGSCVPPMEKPDRGYEVHKELRKKLNAEWRSGMSFGELVEFGAKCCMGV